MLGHAITTELQLLAAGERAADLARAFAASRIQDSARDDLHAGGARPPKPGTTSGRRASGGWPASYGVVRGRSSRATS